MIRLWQSNPALERSTFEKGETRGAQRRPAQSERKDSVFPRNDRPYGLKRTAFQTEIALRRIIFSYLQLAWVYIIHKVMVCGVYSGRLAIDLFAGRVDMKTVQFRIETLPGSGIWTGSADHQKMTAIKGTSLLGGMRFWTEALLRSFGHRVCDCTGDTREVFDGEPESVCAACHSFGCTGLSRAFTLHVMADRVSGELEKTTLKVEVFGDTEKRNYALAEGWRGSLTLSLACRRPLSWPEALWKKEHVSLPPEALIAAFLMMEYGALGAHDQYGCGLVRMTNREELASMLRDCPLPEDGKEKPPVGYADLQDFYFFRGLLDRTALEEQSRCSVSMKEKGRRLPPSFDGVVRVRRLLRDSLRRGGASDTWKELRHWVCGFLPLGKGSPLSPATGSHLSVGVSGDILYGWGWLPRAGVKGLTLSPWRTVREEALDAVYACLKGFCPELVWKEYASPRDTASAKDWRGYVREMIEQPWRKA